MTIEQRTIKAYLDALIAKAWRERRQERAK
jgi:hypothetical protein